MPHRVVVVGGGFGGLSAVKALRSADVEVTLVDRRNYHLFQPLLYQVATGGLSPANIAAPLRTILRRQANAFVLLGDVVAIDPDARRVLLADGELPYDTLILATGARHHYFGSSHFESLAPGLKSIEDATSIRARIITAFEAAERHPDPSAVAGYLTFVVVGGGPTGVEMAGALAELSRHAFRRDYRRFDTASAKVLLVEARERVLATYPAELSEKAEKYLRRIGVTVRTGTLVADMSDRLVTLKTTNGLETVPARNVFWAAGVQASPLAQLVADAAGAKVDAAGRIVVERDCSLPGYANIFVIGDMANYTTEKGDVLPGVAPVAMQQAKFVADCIGRKLKGQPYRRFRYRDRGQLATVGRAAAVVSMGPIRFAGVLAWMAWLLLHLLLLVGFENRVLVLSQWCWNYVTRGRSARLITHSDAVLVERSPPERDRMAESSESTTGFSAAPPNGGEAK